MYHLNLHLYCSSSGGAAAIGAEAAAPAAAVFALNRAVSGVRLSVLVAIHPLKHLSLSPSLVLARRPTSSETFIQMNLCK